MSSGWFCDPGPHLKHNTHSFCLAGMTFSAHTPEHSPGAFISLVCVVWKCPTSWCSLLEFGVGMKSQIFKGRTAECRVKKSSAQTHIQLYMPFTSCEFSTNNKTSANWRLSILQPIAAYLIRLRVSKNETKIKTRKESFLVTIESKFRTKLVTKTTNILGEGTNQVQI